MDLHFTQNRRLHALPKLAFCGALCLAALGIDAAGAQIDLQSVLAQARNFEHQENYAAAESAYQQALALVPGDLETMKRLGVLYQTEMKFPDSIHLFQLVLAASPQYAEVNFFEGVSYLGQNNFQQAIDSFERELKTPKPHPRCRYYLALALRSSGRTDEAIAELDRAVIDNPKDADALYELARIHKDASLQAIERLKDADPDSFQLHALMGEVYADEERYPEAIQEYRAALAKRPDAPGLHYSIGIAAWAQNLFAEAAIEFQQALRENPVDPLTNLYLGDIAVRQQRIQEAMSFLGVAEAGLPGMAQVHTLLGKCHLALKNFDRAKAELLAAIEASTEDAQAHYLLARVYRELGDAPAAARELDLFEKFSRAEKAKKVAGTKQQSVEK